MAATKLLSEVTGSVWEITTQVGQKLAPGDTVMVEESLLSANSLEAMLSKCEFKDSKLRTWKQRIPYFWPKEARGKWSLQIVAH